VRLLSAARATRRLLFHITAPVARLAASIPKCLASCIRRDVDGRVAHCSHLVGSCTGLNCCRRARSSRRWCHGRRGAAPSSQLSALSELAILPRPGSRELIRIPRFECQQPHQRSLCRRSCCAAGLQKSAKPFALALALAEMAAVS
jgi:hypothetical protein